MVVNASTTIYRLVDTANPGSLVKIETLVKNTGTEEQDFRIMVSGVRSSLMGDILFNVFSGSEEISPNEEPFINTYFTMPHETIQVVVQPQWFDRTSMPNEWKSVGGTDTKVVSITGAEPERQVGLPGGINIPPLTLNIPELPWIVGGVAFAALIGVVAFFMMQKKR